MTGDKRVQALPALLIGLAAFLLFTGGGAILLPTNTSWLMSGDPATLWLSWQYFRDTPLLQWPLGANPAYGMEFGSSIVFTDSIPLLALALKPFSPLLPASFQYVGAWIAACFMLQAWFAWKLLRLFVSDRLLALLGVAFFAIAPLLAIRLWGHYGLMGQWMILAALYLYWRPAFSARSWLLLVGVATWINAYLLLMVLAILLADCWQRCWLGQRNWRQGIGLLVGALALVLLLMWAIGYFMVGGVSGVGVGNVPYGRYHMNLHGLFDPDQYWSRAIQDRPGSNTDEYEGFAFFGSHRGKAARIIGRAYAKRHALVPVSRLGQTLTVAMDDPTAAGLAGELTRLTGHTITIVTASSDAIQRTFRQLYEGGATTPGAPGETASLSLMT